MNTDNRIVLTLPCPVKLYDSSMAEEISKTPAAFKGFWLHRTPVKKEICSAGWDPRRVKATIYGAAIYLAREKWDHVGKQLVLNDLCSSSRGLTSSIDLETVKGALRDPEVFVCVLALRENEVLSCFPSEQEEKGYTGEHMLDYLRLNAPDDQSRPGRIRRVSDKDGSSTPLRYSRTPTLGTSRQNREIADYFLSKGIKATKFLEHDMLVVAVYDPSCIRVLSASTDLDLHPFPEVLAAGQIADAPSVAK